MSETIHCTVLNEKDVGVTDGRLRIVIFNDAQEFNLEPSAMVSLGLELIKDGHRQIIERAKYQESVIDSLYDQIHEYERQEGSAPGEDQRRSD